MKEGKDRPRGQDWGLWMKRLSKTMIYKRNSGFSHFRVISEIWENFPNRLEAPTGKKLRRRRYRNFFFVPKMGAVALPIVVAHAECFKKIGNRYSVTTRGKMSHINDAETFMKEIVGVWRSSAMESALKEDGRTTYRRRVFNISAKEFSLLIDVFADHGTCFR